MESLVAAQMRELAEQHLIARFRPMLRPPVRHTLLWEYGSNEPYNAWLFADLGEHDVWAAYCTGGHGALGSPWGMVFKHNCYFGMDAGWFPDLNGLLVDWFA